MSRELELRLSHVHQSIQVGLNAFPHFTSDDSLAKDFKDMAFLLERAARGLHLGKDQAALFVGHEDAYADLMRRARHDYDLVYGRFKMYIKKMRAEHVAGTEAWVSSA